jgi:hypothetical protein
MTLLGSTRVWTPPSPVHGSPRIRDPAGLRHTRCDGPEPRCVPAGRVRPHDATDVLVAVPHVIINVRPLAAQSAFGCAFEDEHWSA